MMCLDLDDKIMERARLDRIGKYSRVGTKIVLWSGFTALILTGSIGIGFLSNMVILGAASKCTKLVIRNRKTIINKVKEIQI